MKVVDKVSVERYRSMANIAVELEVLQRYAEHRHPFVLGLECAFQSLHKLHFVMQYLSGGMLFNHLRSQEMFSERMARFYAAEVALGLEHLHKMKIIYRDLKPENVSLTTPIFPICHTPFPPFVTPHYFSRCSSALTATSSCATLGSLRSV
jgi:serine/threonine protein kinase|tara:strand:- start:386 stop:838 length:453 start_codon:yes stop_codon:yes gene_type:complete